MNLVTILNAAPNAMKFATNPPIAPYNKSLVMVHIPKNITNVGMVIIAATSEPLVIRSILVTFFVEFSVNSYR